MEEIREASLILWATPLYLTFIGLEIMLSNIQQKPVYDWRDTWENFYLSALNSTLDLLMRSVSLVVLTLFYQGALTEIENPVVYWVGLFISLDFLFWLLHFVDHKCRLFLAIHVTHHSSEEFNLTTGFRSSVFQPLYRFFYFIPLAWIGFAPVDILFAYSASQIYGILLHTKWVGRLGPLEWIFVTPSHHRVHHGSNPQYIDKNMGMLLIVWDRLFGTFQEEVTEVTFGITKKLPDRNPTTIVFHEWIDLWKEFRHASGWRAKLHILLGPPGGSN